MRPAYLADGSLDPGSQTPCAGNPRVRRCSGTLGERVLLRANSAPDRQPNSTPYSV